MAGRFLLAALCIPITVGSSIFACATVEQVNAVANTTSTTASGTGGAAAGAGGGATTATTSTSTSTGAGGGGGSKPAASYPAPHPGLPQIPNQGGPVLHDPVIVTVTFAPDDLEAKIQQFDDQIGSLEWWSKVHAGYGVGAAKGGGHVVIATQPPGTLSSGEVEQWLQDRITDKTLPAPTDQTIYALYYPATTVVTLPNSGGGGDLCQSYLGYHSSISATLGANVTDVAYAVIGRCDNLDQVTETASHEFTEAVTDPFPNTNATGYVIAGDTPWTTLGGEDGDMCSGVSGVTEAGWKLTRVWNNMSALAGNQPCLPVPPPVGTTLPYFNAGIVHDTLKAKPGDTVSTEVDCYSFGPLPNDITLVGQPYSATNLTISFDKPTCTNGDKVIMSIAVSANAKHATNYHYTLLSQLDANTAHLWRGMVHVK